MIPIEDVTEGWYVARPKSVEGLVRRHDDWRCVWFNGVYVVTGGCNGLPEHFEFHSRIPMPDATPEERKEDDGE